MTDPVLPNSKQITKQRDSFMDRFLGYASGAFNIFAIYIGDRLGLYRALMEAGPSTASELAERTHTQTRYIREWLEQQAVAGIVEVLYENLSADERHYYLPPGHVEPLIFCESLSYMAPLAQLIAGAVHPMEEILDAYRNGGGVPFSAYGADLREGQAAFNYPAFAQQLASQWLPAMPDVHSRLLAEPPAWVADIGCGFGWSSISIAKGYPLVFVNGFDLDAPSIESARLNAERNQVADRATFQVRDASDPDLSGQYDLVTAFECLHDMSNPVAALRMMRQLAAQDGTVLIVDERVGDTFSPSGNEIDWLMYGFSILHCLPVGMSEPESAGTGTVMRAGTLRSYADEAGFRSVEILPIDHYFFRFYRLNP